MAASNTDKFKKLTNNFSTTLSGAIVGSSDSSMSLSSTTNLPTDTGTVFVIDRVNSSGTATPTLREYVVGTVSGSNVTNLVRGVGNSTAQAHSTGAVVEQVVDQRTINDIVDGLLVEHNQDGTHNNTIVSLLAGSQTFTGAKTFGSGLLKATAPQITTSINDSNGNEVIKTPATSSAVNEVTVTNAATGGSPQISATGDDTNIGLSLSGKASGLLRLSNLIPNLQKSTTTYVGNLIIQTGWDRSQGTSTSRVDKTISFPVTFDTILGVYATHNGFKTTDPSTINGSTSAGTEIITTSAITTSQFVVSIAEKDAGSLGTNWYAYSWIAIGTKA